MQLKTKKLIAREGFVILVLILFALIFGQISVYTGNLYMVKDKNSYDIIVAKRERVDVSKRTKSKKGSIGTFYNGDFVSIDELNDYKNEIKMYNTISVFSGKICFFLLFGAYPLYWIGRFTFWAIKTLKSKEGEK